MKGFSLIEVKIFIILMLIFASLIVDGTIESTTDQDQHLERSCK